MRVHPVFEVFTWTRSNSQFVTCSQQFLAVGGGGRFGLWFGPTLDHGTSGTCSTFNNPCLASDNSFRLVAVEAWAFDRMS